MDLLNYKPRKVEKFHLNSYIYIDDEPFCWDNKLLEFDTDISAIRFLVSVKKATGTDLFWRAEIKQDIVFIDKERLNATSLKAEYNKIAKEVVLIKES